MDANEVTWEVHKNSTSYTEQIQEATSHKTAIAGLPISHL